MDFVGGFMESPSIDAIKEALLFVVEAGAAEEYVETDEASAALVAAEIVAAILGRASQDAPEELVTAIKNSGLTADEKLIKRAKKAVKQVVKESETQELWADVGNTDEWEQVQSGLLKRLSGI